MKTIYDNYPELKFFELQKEKLINSIYSQISHREYKMILNNPTAIYDFVHCIDPANDTVYVVSKNFENYVCSDKFGFLRGLIKHNKCKISIEDLIQKYISLKTSGIIISPDKKYYHYDINETGEIKIIQLSFNKNDNSIIRFLTGSKQYLIVKSGRIKTVDFSEKKKQILKYVLTILLSVKYLRGIIPVEILVTESENISTEIEEDNNTNDKTPNNITWLNESYLRSYSNTTINVRGHFRHYKSGLVTFIKSYNRRYRLDYKGV